MKAKTDYQKQVVAASASLRPELPKRVIEWAKKNALTHLAYRLPSGKTTCLDCGHIWETPQAYESGHHRCPHCHAKIEVQTTNARTHEEKTYFSYITTCKGLQVVRTFRLDVKFSKTSRPVYDWFEICHHWINSQGEVEVMGLRRTPSFFRDSFSYSSRIELRQDSDVYRYVANNFICPYMNVIPAVKRNGFYGEVGDASPVKLFQALMKDNRIETMVKQRRMDAVSHFLYNSKDLYDYWQSYKVAYHNHYDFEDFSMWIDLLGFLKSCGKDIHNPHYICPANLQEAHDHWSDKAQEKKDRERRIREQAKAKAEQANFEKMKGCYFGIVIKDDLLTISVLNSVQAHIDEGNAMHHCVGKADYFKKPDSLIFSARIDGRRIETVELSLKTMKVVQSRGVCNKSTEYHNRIVNLVNAKAGDAIARARRKMRKAV